MSAISTILTRLRAAIWAIDVRDDIANAIEQCYSDVSNPTLQTEALEAALQEKIDQGEMAALTIGDHTITAVKLANGVIPAADATLTEAGKPADAAETGRQIGLIKADLGDFKETGGADKYFSNVKVYGSPTSIGISNIRNNYGSADAKQTGFAIFPATTDTEWGSAIKNVTDAPVSGHFRELLKDGRMYEFDYDLSGLASGTRDTARDAAHVIKKECFYEIPTIESIQEGRQEIYTPVPYNLQVRTDTYLGVTRQQKENGTIVVTGTATENAIIPLYDLISLEGGKTYRLSGCPAGGGGSTYRIDIRDAAVSGSVIAMDTGSGVVFEVSTSGTYYPFIRVNNGYTINATFTFEVSEQTIIEATATQTAVDYIARNGKIDKQQGVENVGKALIVGKSGLVEVGDVAIPEYDMTEPAQTDVPRIYITGTLPTTKEQGEYPVMLTYKSNTEEFTSYATLKVQGDSSTTYPKKNFTIKLFSDSARTVKDKRKFKYWSKYNKFVIKANWIDITHARNVVGAKIWSDMVKSRSDYNDLPTDMLESDNLGCIDGFPVMMYANGMYYGRYSFNLTKDNMLNMDESDPNHAMVQGQGYNSGTMFRNTNVTYWSDELTDDLTHIKTRWQEVLSFVSTSSDADFKANLKNYFSVPSLIDFYIFGLAFFAWDSYGKNQSYLTYDGNYFICSAYDMDNIIGLYWTGTMPFSATDPWHPYESITTDRVIKDNGNNLFKRLATLFDAEIAARWTELRQHGGALSYENVDKRFDDWCSLISTERMQADYAASTAGGAFTGMADIAGGNVNTNNLTQIITFMHDRLEYFDSHISQ